MDKCHLGEVIIITSHGEWRPGPTYQHPPVCYKMESFVPGIAELQCTDAGKDISSVQVKTDLKYELQWDTETVILRVYMPDKGGVARWFVKDKSGVEVSGALQQ